MADDQPSETAGTARGATPRQVRRLAARLAVQAEVGATCSERLARLLSSSAERGDSQRRMAMAEWERQVFEIERYNARRLRSAERPLWLKHLPPLPWGPGQESHG